MHLTSNSQDIMFYCCCNAIMSCCHCHWMKLLYDLAYFGNCLDAYLAPRRSMAPQPRILWLLLYKMLKSTQIVTLVFQHMPNLVLLYIFLKQKVMINTSFLNNFLKQKVMINRSFLILFNRLNCSMKIVSVLHEKLGGCIDRYSQFLFVYQVNFVYEQYFSFFFFSSKDTCFVYWPLSYMVFHLIQFCNLFYQFIGRVC